MEAQTFGHRKVLLASALLVGYLILLLCFVADNLVSRIYFREQDAPVGIGLIALFALLSVWRPKLALPSSIPSARAISAASAILVLFLWGGTYVVMSNYPLTRDEHMVVFDSHIFGHFRLSEPVAWEWRRFTNALVPAFLLDVPGNTVLVSAYMPGNAVMRATFGFFADPALMNPVLTGLGLIALYRIALRLFPNSPGAVWVCTGGYLLSAQVLVNAMTTYAMTGHLVLNLIWLALFLKGGRWSYFCTLLIGFWAIGLHQIIFHPLFAGPFILTLLPQRRLKLFAVYAFFYASFLLFWISYPSLVLELAGIAADVGSSSGAGGFLTERVLPLLRIDHYALPLTAYNLLRMVCWAPAFMLPLLFFSWRSVRFNEGIALPLVTGIILTLLAMVILLPYQGHGWGYRYLHPVLPNFILLCAYGYRDWEKKDKKVADGSVLALACASALAFIPMLIWMTYEFVSPYSKLTQLIALQPSDYVVIDTEYPSYAIDQARNLPDLSNRPLTFSSKDLRPEELLELCSRGTVTFIGRDVFHSVDFLDQAIEESPVFERRRSYLKGRPCVNSLVGEAGL